ncbi:MAG: hypothetical protein RBS89_00940 [Candidatus Delongbacteria bacterium]|jgi:hypothetical protein|nr:hypothetical protein [Candidatus Delongbacteria bacterium]
MAKTKVLITVKTYPVPSRKYDELVCTAGFREDGSWIRIYPVQYRQKPFDQQYGKFDWIEIDLVKNTSDFRPESYRADLDAEIQILGHMGTNDNWQARKEIALKNVYHDLTELIDEAKSEKGTSLATFKPTEILDFKIAKETAEWDPKKISELNLFNCTDEKGKFEIVKKVPYKFSYTFKDVKGKESTLMIEDWEIGKLYWNCLAKHNGDESKALEDVKQKYFNNFVKVCDLHLFLGTTKEFHNVAPNPFIIIGVFYPKKETQARLF